MTLCLANRESLSDARNVYMSVLVNANITVLNRKIDRFVEASTTRNISIATLLERPN